MAGRFVNPYPQMLDSTPDVYSGGKLNFYATGTSTRLDTYTTKALSVANANPVVLNSAGRPAVDIFLQDLEYKVVLTDANDNVIWTADPVSHRDSALIAKTLTGSGSPSGAVAGTAGSSSILPDFYWDYTNSILYVCTTTGTSSTAAWTAVNASSATPAVPPPQGRLTLTTALPVLAADVVSSTAVYYTPYVGNLVPIYNGASMVPTEFSELTLTLAASHALNTLYDVFVFSNSGVLTLATGPAWTTSTLGSCARGTGASTTELTRVKGLYVNAVQMTGRNGSTTYTIGANLGTYLGSIYIDGTAGQVTCHSTYGQSRKWGVWNAYNRKRIILKAGDATATWDYTTAAWRAARNTSANSLTIFSGLPEESYDLQTRANVDLVSESSALALGARSGVGFNDLSSQSGYFSACTYSVSGTVTGYQMAVGLFSHYAAPPSLGIQRITLLEYGSVVNQCRFSGGETGNLLTAVWSG